MTDYSEEQICLAVEYFEQDVELELDRIHQALVAQNRIDFGVSGYDGMQHLVDNDHEVHWIYPEHLPLSAIVRNGMATCFPDLWMYRDNVFPFDSAS